MFGKCGREGVVVEVILNEGGFYKSCGGCELVMDDDMVGFSFELV